MEYRYILVRSTYESDVPAAVYGIALTCDCDGTAAVLQTIPDLSADRERVEHFVALCNALHLDPVHLPDVIEDLLA